ncbi:hypothetical protein [Bartonella henselae]|uniref:hypothetical protein n=1 Tax=Bartonella henselae TaxID=38323 RepID=UPI000969C642|nr:hypothetical protein [Bartonella henselae]OLL37456.1 hypothetical protein AT244_02220 [Bartonella henselae]OLL47647.1 hypothetical protein AT245_03505 [Bartonella henselae]OLL54410.1 hypothetical protein AT238_00005 [Bartonella henselae]UJM34583.1 hypothetical protein KAE75_01405 [Bartonella henselae]
MRRKPLSAFKIVETLTKRWEYFISAIFFCFDIVNNTKLADAQFPLHSFAVCSDKKISKHFKNQDDVIGMEMSDFVLRAIMNAKELKKKPMQ